MAKTARDEGTEPEPEPRRTAGYPRSKGSPRGEARRRQLLDLVSDDLAAHGLVDFSLRRAARAAGTTHKVRHAARLGCPLLVIVCDDERTALPEPAARAAERAPLGELVRIPGGH